MNYNLDFYQSIIFTAFLHSTMKTKITELLNYFRPKHTSYEMTMNIHIHVLMKLSGPPSNYLTCLNFQCRSAFAKSRSAYQKFPGP